MLGCHKLFFKRHTRRSLAVLRSRTKLYVLRIDTVFAIALVVNGQAGRNRTDQQLVHDPVSWQVTATEVNIPVALLTNPCLPEPAACLLTDDNLAPDSVRQPVETKQPNLRSVVNSRLTDPASSQGGRHSRKCR